MKAMSRGTWDTKRCVYIHDLVGEKIDGGTQIFESPNNQEMKIRLEINQHIQSPNHPSSPDKEARTLSRFVFHKKLQPQMFDGACQRPMIGYEL